MHGKVIDVKAAKEDPGTKIVMYKKWDDVRDNQLFWEDKYGYLRSKLTGFAIDTTGNYVQIKRVVILCNLILPILQI